MLDALDESQCLTWSEVFLFCTRSITDMMSRRTFMRVAVAAMCSVWTIAVCADAVEDDAPPNIILILADDQGWNGLSSSMSKRVPGSKSDYYQTPNLDRLCEEGMRFSQGYASATVCSPTRHSIQFGMSPAKIRVTYNNAKNRQLCDPTLALPNLIKKADSRYATAHFGKWHVSFKPHACGYDVSDGDTSNQTGNPNNQPNDPKRVYEVTARSIAFMEKQVEAETPFFLQVSHYADHLTFRSSPKMLEKYQALPPGTLHSSPVFAGMNEDLDRGVGGILDAVDRLGIKNNTFIVYLADNGFDEGHGSLAKRKAWPLSYSKGFVFEGGIRVPFIVCGPGIKAGSFSDVPVIGYDLIPTFLELIDPDFSLPECMEGGSFLPLLNNSDVSTLARPHDFFVFHYPAGRWPAQTSLLQGPFKIVKTWASGDVELFRLDDDLSEQHDISRQMPEKTDELHREMMSYLKRVNAEFPAGYDEATDRIQKEKARASKQKNKKKRI